MPPYGVRRKCGKNPKPVRAAASRPYAVPSTWSVGRGAHTPPGSGRRNHRSPEHNAPGSGRIYNPPLRQDSRRRRNIAVRPVGADCISAHAQPPQLPDPDHTAPGSGGMWACRPTAFGENAVKIPSLFGRLLAAPTLCHQPGLLGGVPTPRRVQAAETTGARNTTHPVPGGYIIRPYGKIPGGAETSPSGL